MAWSKLKSRWRSLLADEVADRVDIHMAGYRKSYDRRGRAWITVDGEEVFTACEFEFENAWRIEGKLEGRTGWNVWSSMAHDKIVAAGHIDKHKLLDAMGECIGHAIDDLLQSPQPLVRALSMLDRRLGRRRLARVSLDREHPLVIRFYKLRRDCSAKGS